MFWSNIGQPTRLVQVLLIISLSNAHAGASTISNAYYSLTLNDDLSVRVQTSMGDHFQCTPTFTIVAAKNDPSIENRPAGLEHVQYNVVTWKVSPQRLQQDKVLKQVKIADGIAGDGFDDRVLRGSTEGRTADLFSADSNMTVSANRADITDNSIRFNFDKNPVFNLRATLTLTGDTREPVLEFSFAPKTEGYYSVGFTGMPAYESGAWEEIWQPLIWQEKRFPDMSYMTLAYRCTLPATMVRVEKQCIALVADPQELPFDPLPLALLQV